MNFTIRHITFILSCLIILSSCAHKRLYKEGKKYEEAGMLELSIEKYNAAITKKNDYVDARIGLNRTIARFSKDLEQKIDNSYTNLDDNQTVEYFIQLQKVKAIADNNQVILEISNRTQDQYDESKNRYLNDHYANVLTEIRNENFDVALQHILDIKKVNHSYKDIAELEKTCRCEPLYRDGIEYMNLGKYRSAHSKFSSVLNIGGDYKDSKALQNESLEKGVLTIAFAQFNLGNSNYQLFAEQITSQIKQNILNANALFLKIVELDNTEAMIREQKIAMQNGIDIKGNLIPVRAHLLCNIPQISYTKTKLECVKKKGFIKDIKKDKSVVYHKVYYYEYSQKATAKAFLSYDLRSTVNGLTMLTNSHTATTSDNIHYIEYSGKNRSALRSGNWKNSGRFNPNEDVVYDNLLSNLAITQLLNARKTLRTTSEMQNILVNDLSLKLSKSLLQFNTE